MTKALIISDGKPGHFNQSIAFCNHLNLDYEIIEVAYKTRACKSFSYLLDHLGIYTSSLFKTPLLSDSPPGVDMIVSTGSTTYYANKLISKKLNCSNVAILLPSGYRLNFNRIICPAYDHPPKQSNITEIPINLCSAKPAFFKDKATEFLAQHDQKKPAVGIIIGGSNAVSSLNTEDLRNVLEPIFKQTEGMERWITTSRRTAPEVEKLIESLPFDYTLINSRDPYNPVPAFIHLCERILVTSDSASMISECASFGSAKIEVLMNRQVKSPNKFEELIQGLEKKNAVHVYNGSFGEASEKIDVTPLIKDAL
jgi:mitochondrial fission protein ELM1